MDAQSGIWGENIGFSTFFLKTLSSSSVPLLSEEETYVYTNVQSLFLNGIFVNEFLFNNNYNSAACPCSS